MCTNISYNVRKLCAKVKKSSSKWIYGYNMQTETFRKWPRFPSFSYKSVKVKVGYDLWSILSMRDTFLENLAGNGSWKENGKKESVVFWWKNKANVQL